MLLPCLMWLLGFCSLSAGVPVSSTKGAASASGNETVSVLHPAVNQTSGEASMLGASQNVSAETVAEIQSDMPVQEGDLLIGEDRNAVNMVWSNGVVPYVISPELAHRMGEILQAFNMIMMFTCITFQPHTNELNYIEIKDGRGCASMVGCSGGSQPVYFDSTCSKGNLCHELIHTLGLYHEHTRQDRDQYITINWPNILPGKKGNFEIKSGNTLNLPYDYDSIMHYGPAFFSVDGTPTIMTKGGWNIGQRQQLSQLDIQKLNALYHC
uniref:Metalloendopeptidase n=1 Tax=Kryptolebias marmoratus TaxID=37003 RepID=A0A3Q2ZJA1_KRYMA